MSYNPKLAINQETGAARFNIAAYFSIPITQVHRINIAKAYAYFGYLGSAHQRLEHYLDMYYGRGLRDMTMHMPGNADD